VCTVNVAVVSKGAGFSVCVRQKLVNCFTGGEFFCLVFVKKDGRSVERYLAFGINFGESHYKLSHCDNVGSAGRSKVMTSAYSKAHKVSHDAGDERR